MTRNQSRVEVIPHQKLFPVHDTDRYKSNRLHYHRGHLPLLDIRDGGLRRISATSLDRPFYLPLFLYQGADMTIPVVIQWCPVEDSVATHFLAAARKWSDHRLNSFFC